MTIKDSSSGLVRRLWQYCNVLRDDGLSYPDYVEQLTYLLFLKMSDEQEDGPVPPKLGWGSFSGMSADAIHSHYGDVLEALGKRDGMLGLVFRNAKNKIRDPAKLQLLIVDLIGQTEWTGLSDDLKGDAYEGLLEKNARDTKSGAGQYFTPRPLIEAIVQCVDPKLGEVVCDPACGTGGFLIAAYDHLRKRNPRMSKAQQSRLTTKSIRGVELVEEVARLATMNLMLHGISGQTDDELPIKCEDSLKMPPTTQYDVVLTNPPFGTKGTVKYVNSERQADVTNSLTVSRSDFWVQTANKQLNFVQHIYALLKPGGRAAVVVPDNVLFEHGVAAAVRRRLLEVCNVHTLLRLPPGLFYAHGVKANVLFFDRHRKQHETSGSGCLWVYDLRSDNRFTLKTNPLQREDLLEFVQLFSSTDREEKCLSENSATHSLRWRCFQTRSLIESENCSLDLTWDVGREPSRSVGLSRLDDLSRQIADDLTHAIALVSEASRSSDNEKG